MDLLVRGGRVIDGTGAPARVADVGVRGDRIARVGQLDDIPAQRVIDARDRIVAPGFIDVQSQSIFTLLADGNAESHIRQGITTEIVGEGQSPGQLTPKILEQDRRYGEWLAALGLKLDWTGFDGWFERLEERGTSVNVGALASIDLLRAEVMGLDDRPATRDELDAMRALLNRARREGVLGLGAALAYPPASYAGIDELVALAKVAGLYATHVRSESTRVIEAIEEAITIGERAKVPVLLFHLKVAGRESWGRMKDIAALVEEAQSHGVAITACQYPYAAAGAGILAPIPAWAHDGGPSALLARLADPSRRARIRREMEERDIFLGHIDFETIHVGHQSIGELARARGEDPWNTYFGLVIEHRTNLFATYHAMSEDDVRTAMRLPWVSIASDAEATSPAQGQQVHPRAYGTFPRVLGRYVRDEGVLTLEEAIRKMTSLPASQVGITDRGVVREGAFADLVIFDPKTVIDHATFEAPHAYPIGIDWVVVNGAVTIEHGAHTGARAGRSLRAR